MHRTLLSLVLLASALLGQQVTHLSVPSGFSSISGAMLAAPAVGVTIISVAPGTYYENINFGGKAITLRATVPGAVILDGSRGGSTVVKFVNGEGPLSGIDGFVIRGGRGNLLDPGGILCQAGSAPVFSNCRIEGNTGGRWEEIRGFGTLPGGPGGVLAWNAAPTFFDCVITNNQGGEGGVGGIELRGAHPMGSLTTMDNTEITSNTGGRGFVEAGGLERVAGGAGGMRLVGSVSLSMRGGSISGNTGGAAAVRDQGGTSSAVGGLSLESSSSSAITFRNMKIADNVGGAGAVEAMSGRREPGAPGGLEIDVPSVRFENALVVNNRGGTVVQSPLEITSPQCGPGAMLIGSGATSAVVFQHCTIADNQGGTRLPNLVSNGGPGGMIIAGSPTFSHCIHQSNVSGLSGSLYATPPAIVIAGNGAPSITWSNFDPSFAGVGNINEDSIFALPNDGSYRLATWSPCVNRGDPNFNAPVGSLDFEGEPRVQYGITDMGHDEFGNAAYLQPGTTSGDNLRLTVNGSPWQFHQVTPGDLTTIEISGPGLANAPVLLVWQPFVGLPGPVSWPGLSEIHINPFIPYYFLFGPTSEAILGPASLSPTFTTTIPSPVVLTGIFARLQAIAITSQAANGSHAATLGHDILYF